MVDGFLVLLFEMIIVGVTLAAFQTILLRGSVYISNQKQAPNVNWSDIMIIFVSGALFHFVCELTGVNEMYVCNYRPLLGSNNPQCTIQKDK
jgi:hypothetical protein